MRRAIVRRMSGSLGMVLALIISSSATVRGGYSPPSQASSLLGEAVAFVADFGQWNTSHDELPLQFLQMTPAHDRGEAAIVLFWLWLHDAASLLDNGASLSSLLSSTNASNLRTPNDPIGSTVGSIGIGTTDNGSPTSLSNGGGDDKTSHTSNSGSILALNNPPMHNGDDDGQFGGGDKSSPGSSHPSGSTKLLIDPVPEPRGLTLLFVGGIGLLLGWWMRVRKLSNVEFRQLASAP